ncbi:hypothetical protein K458DRAFT_434778 [Lentithecium fluviatile CBS 122367]|uniref:Uncharacterized protein n=1 Tax=Lentithecium fluviatile CBS 122367 TaxID=1168545 RepID=A0A6G1IP15_9PLEO|nr:hypothetical protein K458DRAFT_434778 [Lentithecium fluviatile CBS 122367]
MSCILSAKKVSLGRLTCLTLWNCVRPHGFLSSLFPNNANQQLELRHSALTIPDDSEEHIDRLFDIVFASSNKLKSLCLHKDDREGYEPIASMRNIEELGKNLRLLSLYGTRDNIGSPVVTESDDAREVPAWSMTFKLHKLAKNVFHYMFEHVPRSKLDALFLGREDSTDLAVDEEVPPYTPRHCFIKSKQEAFGRTATTAVQVPS